METALVSTFAVPNDLILNAALRRVFRDSWPRVLIGAEGVGRGSLRS